MRSEDDSGTTYILDGSLLNLINRWRSIFDECEWFLEALFIVNPTDNSVTPYYSIVGENDEQGEE